MSVAFNAIPGNLLVPFFYAEINSGGSPYQGNARLLLIGQKTSGGSATANIPVGPIQSAFEADALFGVGSMLAHMYRAARRAAPFQPIWALPLADPAGAAAAGTITITAPGVTGAGVFHIMGRRLTVQINAADNAATVAAAMVAAITAAGLPVTAAVGGTGNEHVITVTARHVGALGNGQEILIASDEPNALNSTNAVVVAMANGSGVPSLTTGLANLGDDEFDFIGAPYADSTSLNSIRDFLDGVSGRWAPIQQLYGHYFSVYFGNLSSCVSLGNGRNDPHVTIMASQVSPTPQWEWAAAYAATAIAHLADAPELSRPLQTLVLPGILPPRSRAVWWDIPDRQALYADGMAGYRVTVDGLVVIDRACTTYQVTGAGVADATFRDTETMAQAMFLARYFRVAVSNRHARQALADENPHNLSEVATPKSVRLTCIHAYNDLVALGVAENPDLFAQYVKVERDPNDATRLNAYLPVDVVNQLRVFAANVTMFLQYRTPSGAPVNL